MELLLQSRYRIVRRLHVGGMSEVFLAEQQGSVRRQVALKRMLPALAASPSMRERFAEEAQLLTTLAGPGIPALYESGEDEGLPFLVLQYIPGANLREILEAHGALSAGETATILKDTLTILARLHTAKSDDGKSIGFVHRDLAPENLQIGKDGNLWILDLGIAKANASRVRTEAGVRQGRLCYMSPEVARGEKATGASDIFSLAAVAAELLGAGGLLSENLDVQVALSQAARGGLAARLSWPSAVPADFRRMLESALADDPLKRPGVASLLEQLPVDGSEGRLSSLAEQAVKLRSENEEPSSGGQTTPRLPADSSSKPLAKAPLILGGAVGALLLMIVVAILGASRGILSDKTGVLFERKRRMPEIGVAPTDGPVTETRLRIVPPEGGEFLLYLDGKPQGILSDEKSLEVTAGIHTVVLTSETTSRYYRKDFLVTSGEEKVLTFSPEGEQRTVKSSKGGTSQ